MIAPWQRLVLAFAWKHGWPGERAATNEQVEGAIAWLRDMGLLEKCRGVVYDEMVQEAKNIVSRIGGKS